LWLTLYEGGYKDAQPLLTAQSKLDAQLYRFGTQSHFCIAYVIGCYFKIQNMKLSFKESLLLEIQRLKEIINNLTKLHNNFDESEAKKNIHVLVDAGHGGNHPKTSNYMTPPNIGKKYRFVQENIEIREGVINREIANIFCDMLDSANIKYTKLHHAYLDNSLFERVQTANRIHAEKKAEGKKVVLMSFHSNAFGFKQSGTGEAPQGWSVWTTKGNTDSDRLADAWYLNTKKLCGQKITYRIDKSDNDFDWEANFQILFHTTMPAVLVENLFFTNLQDAKLLLNKEYQKASAKAAFNTVIWAEKNL